MSARRTVHPQRLRTPSGVRRALLLALVAVPCVLLALVLSEGLRSRRALPIVRELDVPATAAGPDRLVVLAYNVATCGFYRGGLSFRTPAEVRARVHGLAEVLQASGADVVFVSEIVQEAGPCPVDQVEALAREAGFRWTAFGENYSFGLPWYRIRSGNAVLSRVPLRGVAVQRLRGDGSLFDPTNARRALWVELELASGPVLAASVRNDSFDAANNLRHAEELLAFQDGRPALLAGDFNAEPDSASLRLFRQSGLFAPSHDGAPTFPSSDPRRRIDFVLAPASWTVLEEATLASTLSDHLPVVATFALPER